MGRWMQKVQKGAEAVPAKPPKATFAGSAGMPSAGFQKKQPANDELTPQQVAWLAAVASLLEVGTMHLIEGGFVGHHDLDEQLEADPNQAAALIRSDPRWYH